MLNFKKLPKGFTLIELLVVIGILGILLAIVLIAINPAAQFAQANNTARTNDVNTILNAVHQYGADHKGNLVALGLPTAPDPALEIMGGVGNPGGADVCALLSPDYVSLFPVDPDGPNNGAAVGDCTADYQTAYFIVKDASGRITVSAPSAETVRGVAPVISVTR
ncbi:MAG TPA: type II secretion system protein [Patescibacteria group bacterium]|nr:type II secretion system protein [Patescibacteria group bacterium]